MLDDTDSDEEWPTEPPQDPPPPPRVFPRTKWKTAPLENQHYPKHRTSAFEIAVAAKKASIAWVKARDSGDWSGAEDKRWFILAVADRAHQRKEILSDRRAWQWKKTETLDEFRRLMRPEILSAYCEALMTQDYPYEYTPGLHEVMDTVSDMIDQYYGVGHDGTFFFPYSERPLVPLSALAHFAPCAGDPEVRFTRLRHDGGEWSQEIEYLRDSRRVISETKPLPPLGPQVE